MQLTKWNKYKIAMIINVVKLVKKNCDNAYFP